MYTLTLSAPFRPVRPAFAVQRHNCVSGQRLVAANAQKGFASEPKASQKPSNDKPADAEPATSMASAGSQDEAIDALEARIRSRRAKKSADAKVKVQSAVVDTVTGKAPLTAANQAEAGYVATLTVLFGLIILEGLALAGAGFLPEEWDAFLTDQLYPTYSPTVVVFLLLSSLYGLYKTGKLPGMTQQ